MAERMRMRTSDLRACVCSVRVLRESLPRAQGEFFACSRRSSLFVPRFIHTFPRHTLFSTTWLTTLQRRSTSAHERVARRRPSRR